MKTSGLRWRTITTTTTTIKRNRRETDPRLEKQNFGHCSECTKMKNWIPCDNGLADLSLKVEGSFSSSSHVVDPVCNCKGLRTESVRNAKKDKRPPALTNTKHHSGNLTFIFIPPSGSSPKNSHFYIKPQLSPVIIAMNCFISCLFCTVTRIPRMVLLEGASLTPD